MRYNSDQTQWAKESPDHAHAALLWWNAPLGILGSGKRRTWISAAIAALLLAATIAATSLWNYYGLSLPVRDPSTDVTALVATHLYLAPSGPTASTQWEFEAGQPLSAPPTPAGDETYIVSGSRPDTGAITSLRTSHGSHLWTVKLGSISDYSPIVAGDMVFVGTRGGDLHALDRNTGIKVWTADLESSVVGSPIIRAGIVYIASRSIFALDAATGQQLWRHEVGGDVSRPLRMSNGVISAISSDGNVNLISATNGRRRLTFPLWFSTSAGPAVSGTTLVVPGDRAFVQALDIDEREIPMEKAIRYWWTKLWLWDMAPRPPLPRAYLWQNRELGGDTAYALGADSDSVYLGISENDGSGTLVALDLTTGQAQWEQATASTTFTPATQTEDSLIVGVESGDVLAFDKQNGGILWRLHVEGGLSSAPNLAGDGLLLVHTTDGTLRAFR